MKRKQSRNRLLSLVSIFVAILTLSIAAAVLAQQTEAGQRFASPVTSLVSRHASVPAVSDQGKPSHETPAPNDSSSLFVPGVAYFVGTVSHAVTVADVNGDGKLDLLTASGFSVGVLLGNGDGTFQTVQSYGFTDCSYPNSLAVGDVNGDGVPDLLVSYQSKDGNSDGCVGVLLGNGNGTFRAAGTYDSSGFDAINVAVGDVNGDGKLDIVVINVCPFNNGCGNEGTLSVLLGNGNGTFQATQVDGTGALSPVSVLIADVNRDGKPDLLVSTECTDRTCDHGAVGVLLGNGNGTFQTAQNYASGGSDPGTYPSTMAVADVNGDGKLDVVVSSQCSDSSCDRGEVGVLLGNGDGTFQTVRTYSSGGYGANGVAVADVNGDGKLDLLVANDCSSISNCQIGFAPRAEGEIGVLLGNGDGTFQAAQIYDSGGWGANGVAVGSLNGDAKLVLIASNICGTTCVGQAGVVGVLLSNDGRPTTTTTLQSADPIMPNQTVTYTAAVQSSGEPLTGSVAFEDSWTPVATVNLSAGQATYTTSYSKTGLHPITAVYIGDPHNAVSTSNTVVESITSGLTKTTTTLATSGSPSAPGQPVTFTATVTWNYGTVPNGEPVTFYDGTTALGTGATANGIATFVTSTLKARTQTIKAAYPGDVKFHASSGTVKQVVEKYSTTTALTSSLNPSGYKQAVTFTATVATAGPQPPTGKVTFKDGTIGLGTATLSGGVATLTKSMLAVGTHPITAQYLGDAGSAQSTSAVLDQVVQ